MAITKLQPFNLDSTANYTFADITTTNANLGAVGNITITGGTSGYVLSTDGSGTLSWVAQSGGGGGGNTISNGNSSVAIPTANGNINLTAVGNTTMVVTGTGANIAGTLNVSGAITGIIVPKVVTITDGTSVTMNADTTELAIQTNTQAAGTLTINAPTGTLSQGQKITFRLQSANIQTFSWNAVFTGSVDLPLPTVSSGSNKYDYMGFIYNTTASKWQLLAKNFGF